MEIKTAYRKLALVLHPDRHKGDDAKTRAFREVTEAYDTLSDHRKRTAYDLLHGRRSSRRMPPDYRKVYAPRPPPGFKIFDPKEHYDYHYGDGILRDEMKRAQKRAKEAAGKVAYKSPLGPGFSFHSVNDRNPYARKGTPQGPRANSPGMEFEYEEAYVDMGNARSARKVGAQRENIRVRLHERRKLRIEREKHSPRQRNRKQQKTEDVCSIM